MLVADNSINATPLLHLLIPLHPLLIVYIVVVAVAAPELKWRDVEGRGEEGC